MRRKRSRDVSNGEYSYCKKNGTHKRRIDGEKREKKKKTHGQNRMIGNGNTKQTVLASVRFRNTKINKKSKTLV